MFYAGYEDWLTTEEVAVFETEEERDNWIKGDSYFKRRAYNDYEVFLMEIDLWDEEVDVDGVKWKVCTLGE